MCVLLRKSLAERKLALFYAFAAAASAAELLLLS
jgi:hypothetical protein